MDEFKNFAVEGTPKTPEVNLDGNSGVVLLRGRSIPENSIDFFQPIYSWIDKYSDNPNPTTTLQIRLEYFNTSSSKCILDLFRKFEKINGKSKVVVEWYFETDDEDMEEAGEDYQAIVELPFTMIEVEEI
ncbi:MAG: DUF1987 domain-containing protein [Crocinitomicaceae bacterium]|nr:DUF1987 domain-containing protein [Crocinitomicaceae bacterium]